MAESAKLLKLQDTAIIIGSDIQRDGMFVEVQKKTSHQAVVEVFYSDATHTFAITAWMEEIPLDIVENAISVARQRLVPVNKS